VESPVRATARRFAAKNRGRETGSLTSSSGGRPRTRLGSNSHSLKIRSYRPPRQVIRGLDGFRENRSDPNNLPMELNNFTAPSSYSYGSAQMPSKNERVELEIKIMKYRAMARQVTDDQAAQRLTELIAELQQKKREIDE
jgi:hypothetical protein